jgi:hypothetical protein
MIKYVMIGVFINMLTIPTPKKKNMDGCMSNILNSQLGY